MKIKQIWLFNLYDKNILLGALTLLVFFLAALTILCFEGNISLQERALSAVVLAGMLLLMLRLYVPMGLKIENNELRFRKRSRRERPAVSFIIRRYRRDSLVYFTVRKITKIEYGQNRLERLFCAGHATIYGEFLTNNRHGNPISIEKNPFRMTFYGIKKFEKVKTELDKLVGVANKINIES
ncbi:MAG: hypothetical protein E7596_04420 [Ruminococcaceae bacterium]|nr:hypothetical protein [Oscillospiraceae bacterium]